MNEERKVRSAWLSFPCSLVQPHPYLAALSSGNRRLSTHRSSVLMYTDCMVSHKVPRALPESTMRYWETAEIHNNLLPSENAWLHNLKQRTSVACSMVILDRNFFAVGAMCSTVLPLISIKNQIQSFNNLFLYIWECFSIIHLSLQISTQE